VKVICLSFCILHSQFYIGITMAKQDRSAFKAGLFIVVAAILGGFIIVGIKGVRTIFTPKTERKVRFALKDDLGGLRVGDDVRLGGYKIGRIEKIDVQGLEDGQQPSIAITFTMPTMYPIHNNAYVRVQGTLTGSSWLNIDNLGTGGPMLADAELEGHPAAFTQLFDTLGGAAPDIAGLLKDVRTTTVPKVNNTLDSAGGTLARASEMAVQIRDLFGDTKTDFRGTVANLNVTTSNLKDKLPALLDHVDVAIVKINDTLDSARGSLEDIKATVANTKDLTGSARSLIVSNRGKFESLISSLKLTGDNLKAASSELRRSPWRLLYKPEPGEMENLTLFDAARQFADGASNVNDASQALRDAAHDPKVSQEQMKKLLEKLDESFAAFRDVEKKLWETVQQ